MSLPRRSRDGKTRESGKPGDLPKSSVLQNLRGKIQERHNTRVFCSTLSFFAEDRVFYSDVFQGIKNIYFRVALLRW